MWICLPMTWHTLIWQLVHPSPKRRGDSEVVYVFSASESLQNRSFGLSSAFRWLAGGRGGYNYLLRTQVDFLEKKSSREHHDQDCLMLLGQSIHHSNYLRKESKIHIQKVEEGGKEPIIRACKCFCWLGPLRHWPHLTGKRKWAHRVLCAILWDRVRLSESVSILLGVFAVLHFSEVFAKTIYLSENSFQGSHP